MTTAGKPAYVLSAWREGARIRQADGLGYADTVHDDEVAQHVRDDLERGAYEDAAFGSAGLALRQHERGMRCSRADRCAVEVSDLAEKTGTEPGHEHCPDCGCNPQDHTAHADGCRRIGTTVELQCGPPWNPWPDAGHAATGGSS